MDVRVWFTVFLAVFVAELGDKTQLATMMFAADKEVSRLTVFLAASAALVCAAGLGVLAGGFLSNHVGARQLNYVAGAGFVAIGVWTLLRAHTSAA